ncbi:diadenylate cyclase [Hymenobacter actinosclerus]|uniref:DisA checkpoint controller nucleotide-binding n=1 Tax=Hymenobacter actinosclerus TaxID=82805 RepID=A0A1I0EL68_9BACT|nr:diadenylate cyclase [Hymenobacter actinosclerus]SET46189.1 DisA checkpoint controller nucleotide-binding [Hymenobacter actinosclerus]
MWENQSLFRVSAQLFADGVFNLLDRALKPEVFLLGIASARETDEPQAVVIEPQSHRYTPADFAAVKEHAVALEPDGPREVVYHLHQLDHDRFEKQRWYELLRRATEHTLHELVGQRQEERVSFCSLPVSTGGYQVLIVLQLSAEAYHSYYALPGPAVPNRPASLLAATVEELLLDASRALRESDHADDDRLVLNRDYNEVLRAAGRRFMLRAAAGSHGLYDACNGIAALRHEGDEGVGTMLVSRRNHPAVVPVLTLDAPVPLRDYRRIRKLLELSEDRHALITDATDVFGLGYLVEPDDAQYEPVFTVHFTKHYSWELSHDGQRMMKVVSNTPRLPQGTIDENNFTRAVSRIFPVLDAAGIAYLWELTLNAAKQEHGTILLISEGAAQEAVRLSPQCFRVTPRLMTPSVLRLVTNIDGAVLIEPSGTCHAIGAILDGLATEKGDSSRGSRYNSVLRYVESSRYPVLAVVVSEDGWIDLLPPVMR